MCVNRHNWEVLPRFGGGDMFTLRKKAFVYEVINTCVERWVVIECITNDLGDGKFNRDD
jgi:hypothetical protein